MHLDPETLERVLHGELDDARDAPARDHLTGCPACAAALEESELRERRVFGLLERLDHEVPDLDWKAVESASRGGGGFLIAASIACILAAGMLYAFPDSPLRSWIERVREEAPTPGAAAGSGGSQSVSGLSIRPIAPFEIVFAGMQESGEVRIAIADTPELEISVLGAPVDLESGPDRVRVANLGSRSSYAVRLPDAGPTITVRVGNAVVLVRSGTELRTAAPRGDSGEYRIDLTRPRP